MKKHALFLLLMSSTAFAGNTGLKPITANEISHMKTNLGVKKIKSVMPTALGLKRINDERVRNGQDPLPASQAKPHGQDTATDDEELAGATTTFTEVMAGALPAAVDNSLLSSFPPIQWQTWNNCVAWSMGYYQLTHNLGQAMGYSAKTDVTKRCSPKQIYNMINAGSDNGAYFSDGLNMIGKHGCISWDKFPEDIDYKAWDLNPTHWQDAISWRSNPYQIIQAIDTAAGLDQVKQLLTNGYVLTYGTYINSWQYTTIKSGTMAGQKVMHWVNGTNGSHAMTIVGFDDNAWVDINNNGVTDAGEMGVLKIANSWGTSWGNGGYMWIAYDALKSSSAVSGGPSLYRQPAIQNKMVYHQTVKASAGQLYTPKYLAKFTVNHAQRNQLSLKFGWSDSSNTSPTVTYSPFAIVNKGGAYSFNGTSSSVAGTFVMDISDLPITSYNNKLYLTMSDNAAGSSASLSSFQIIDVANGTQGAASISTPLYADASAVTATLNYTKTTGNVAPVASFSASTLSGNAPLATNFDASSAYDPDGTINSYSWNFGDGATATGAYVSHTYNAGTFNPTLTVTDNNGATATTSKTVTASTVVATTDTIAPSVTLTSPLNGARYARYSTVTATANASDNVGVDRVRFYVNGYLKCTDYSAPYSCAYSMPYGTKISVYARAFDSAGNYRTSSYVYISN